MDAVFAHQQRDAQARLLGESVSLDDPLRGGVEDRADVHLADQVREVAAGVELQHLAHLLFERHALEQVGEPLVDGQ